MKINQYYFEPTERDKLTETWKLAFIGNSKDDRGDFSREFIKEKSQNIKSILYDPNKFSISIDDDTTLFEGNKFSYGELKSDIVIDLTTVGFVELLYLLRIAKKENCDVNILYFEPVNYKKFKSDTPVIQKQYDLSTIVNDFSSLPGFTIVEDLYDAKEHLFLAGYESNRIEAAFEYKETINGMNSHILFGIPAYNAGWETNALFNNIEVIDGERITASINYSCASDVIRAYYQIKKIVEALPDNNSNLCLLPLSNKPMSLAAALILLNYTDKTNLLYDHPMESSSRSLDVGRVHCYKIKWNE